MLGLRQNPLKPEEIPSAPTGFLLDSASAILRVRSGLWIMGKVSLTPREAELLLLQLMGKKQCSVLLSCLLCEEKFWEGHLWSMIYLLWCFRWEGHGKTRKSEFLSASSKHQLHFQSNPSCSLISLLWVFEGVRAGLPLTWFRFGEGFFPCFSFSNAIEQWPAPRSSQLTMDSSCHKGFICSSAPFVEQDQSSSFVRTFFGMHCEEPAVKKSNLRINSSHCQS